MSKPAEILVFEFLEAAQAAVASDSILIECALHDTVYQNIKTGQNLGIRLGEPQSDFSPGREDDYKEWDAEVPIACFARVRGTEKTNRQESLQQVFEISVAVAALFYTDPTLGGRVCDSIPLRWMRGFDEMDGEPFAVSNTSLVINPSGQYNFNKSR